MASTQFCTFYLEGLFFGVDVLKVQEVLRYQEMTQVPLASSVVRGLINLRGQIVTAIDLRRRLNLPDRESDDLFMNVIVNTSESDVSLLVDAIGDVLEMSDELFEMPPHNLDKNVRSLVRGIYKLDSGLLLILDTEKTAQLDHSQLTEMKGVHASLAHHAN